jgi:hypothetical protein
MFHQRVESPLLAFEGCDEKVAHLILSGKAHTILYAIAVLPRRDRTVHLGYRFRFGLSIISLPVLRSLAGITIFPTVGFDRILGIYISLKWANVWLCSEVAPGPGIDQVRQRVSELTSIPLAICLPLK